jgi:hypothetical protein
MKVDSSATADHPWSIAPGVTVTNECGQQRCDFEARRVRALARP